MEENEIKKYSYEELEGTLKKVMYENLQMRKAIEEISANRAIQRLEFLFKIIDHNFEFGEEVSSKAVKEITESLFSTETENSNNEEVKAEKNE